MSEDIRAYWCFSNNFGDALTPYLIHKLSGKNVIYTEPSSEIVTYMATGSMLDGDITNSIVWGCGIAWRNDNIPKPLEIRAVRGPISRQRTLECGHECPSVFGDPALLLPELYVPNNHEQYRVGIIPHYVDHDRVINAYGGHDDVKIINILDPIETVIDNVAKCKKIISSSLHGLIVAQAYEKPNLWVEFSNDIIGDGTKFVDFLLSIGAEPYKPMDLREFGEFDTSVDRISYSASKIDLQKLKDACPFNDLKIF